MFTIKVSHSIFYPSLVFDLHQSTNCIMVAQLKQLRYKLKHLASGDWIVAPEIPLKVLKYLINISVPISHELPFNKDMGTSETLVK